MIEARFSSVCFASDGPSAKQKGETAEDRFRGREKAVWAARRICGGLSRRWSAIIGLDRNEAVSVSFCMLTAF